MSQQVNGPGPQSPAPYAAAPTPRQVERGRRRSAAAVTVLLVLSAAVAVLMAQFLASTLGPDTLFVVGLLALVPLAIVMIGVWWIDRWDPEPRGWLAFAVLWGAGVSVFGTLVLGEVFMAAFAGMSSLDADTFGAVVQAPVVEESMKGAGLIIIFLAARSHFDGPVDGVVYAGMVAAGFAFTENILYFGTAYTEAGWGPELAFTFVLRGLFSPFAHVLFTVWIGFFLGVAAHRMGPGSHARPSRWAGWFLLGLTPAVAGHFLWNGGLALIFDDFFSFYVLLQVPLFLAAIAAVLLLMRGERRLAHEKLAHYERTGWLLPQETVMFGTRAGRVQSRRWARRAGAGDQLLEFERTARRLAAVRHRIDRGHDVERNVAEESRLLRDSVRQRQELLAAVNPGGVSPAGSA
jgi:RsiW-degrading membrane proteinase PrsW (M82 family)